MDIGQLEDPIPAGACETLPARYYTDRDVFAEETEKILARTWHLVGHRSQVADKGDCDLVHKAFTDGIVAPDSYRIVTRGMSHHHHARSQPSGRQSCAWEAGVGKKTDTFAAWYLWPLTAVQACPGGVGMTFRWIPVGPDETKVEVDWWLESAEPRPLERDLIEQHARTTFPEDIPLVESVQRSMRSRTFDRGFVLVDRDRGQASEHGIKAFNDLYLRHMSGPDA